MPQEADRAVPSHHDSLHGRDREVGVNLPLLRDVAYLGLMMAAELMAGTVEYLDRTIVRTNEAQYGFEQCRLSGSVGADNPDKFTLADLQADILQGRTLLIGDGGMGEPYDHVIFHSEIPLEPDKSGNYTQEPNLLGSLQLFSCPFVPQRGMWVSFQRRGELCSGIFHHLDIGPCARKPSGDRRQYHDPGPGLIRY